MLLFPGCLLTERAGTSAGGKCAFSTLYGSPHATLNLKKKVPAHLIARRNAQSLEHASRDSCTVSTCVCTMLPTPKLQTKTGEESQQLQKVPFMNLNSG